MGLFAPAMPNTSKNRLFCPIRQKEVVGRPEERIRQGVIDLLLQLGYPLAYMQIEPLCTPRLARRGDLLVMRKSARGKLSPLFLIECKAGVLRKPHFYQLIGYNHFIQAPCVGLTNGEIWHLNSSWTGPLIVSYPLPYEILCQQAAHFEAIQKEVKRGD